MTRACFLVVLAACGSSGHAGVDVTSGDAGDAASGRDAAASTLGTVSGVTDLASCPRGAPANASCKQISVAGCPGIASESIDATVAILDATGTPKGTIVHFSGGGGEGFEVTGAQPYAAAGYRQVFVSWASDWEQTQSSGIKTAGCRPATVIQWAFDTVHGASRTEAFCGQGFSGGSAQLGYALATYGLGSLFDYVNELSGPPFARIDLGCDGTQPATATVCGATVTMRLPSKLDNWENVMAPDSCGGSANDAAQIVRWHDDSIAVGGTYAYPNTRVEFFDCTNQPTAVTAMAQLYEQLITTDTTYHCYTQQDGCQGESLGSGGQAATAAMQAGCTPRH